MGTTNSFLWGYKSRSLLIVVFVSKCDFNTYYEAIDFKFYPFHDSGVQE